MSSSDVVEIFSENPRDVRLTLYDDLGRTVMAVDQYHLMSGVHDYSLEVPHHSHRMIILDLTSDQGRKTFKLF